MEFINSDGSSIQNAPWNKDTSDKLGYYVYYSDQACSECNSKPVSRFVDNDKCVNCSNNHLKETWSLWVQGSPDKPDPFPKNIEQAINCGVDYFYTPNPCNRSSHFKTPNIKTGRCVICAGIRSESTEQKLMRDTPDAIITRDIASMLGLSVFRTGLPCKHGHKGWRYRSTSGCIPCLKGEALAPVLVTEHETFSIKQQREMFFGYAWDGRKFIGPDAKKWNKLQFSSMFPGPARYEGSNSYYAADAFIKNFTRQ